MLIKNKNLLENITKYPTSPLKYCHCLQRIKDGFLIINEVNISLSKLFYNFAETAIKIKCLIL